MNEIKNLNDAKVAIAEFKEILGDQDVITDANGEKIKLKPIFYGDELKINMLMEELKEAYREEGDPELSVGYVIERLRKDTDTERHDKLFEMMACYTGFSVEQIKNEKFGLSLSCDVMFDFFEFSSIRSILKQSKLSQMASKLKP